MVISRRVAACVSPSQIHHNNFAIRRTAEIASRPHKRKIYVFIRFRTRIKPTVGIYGPCPSDPFVISIIATQFCETAVFSPFADPLRMRIRMRKFPCGSCGSIFPAAAEPRTAHRMAPWPFERSLSRRCPMAIALPGPKFCLFRTPSRGPCARPPAQTCESRKAAFSPTPPSKRIQPPTDLRTGGRLKSDSTLN